MDADRRAHELLASVVGAGDAAMFCELGFMAVAGGQGRGGYGYLVYAQRPLVAYDVASRKLLCEYCVRFAEPSAERFERLPDADDVLAKWLALAADERRLIATANAGPPGRQIDPAQARADLEALEAWSGRRARPAVQAA